MVGVQGDPLVQHLPADAQLRVAALEELEGDQRHHVHAAGVGTCQPCSTAPPVPSLLPFLSGAPVACHPMFFLQCMKLEEPTS